MTLKVSAKRLAAELYALTHRGNPGDIAFYAKACKQAESVLELGAGYGRLLPALAHVAGAVVGLERDKQLLAAAREVKRQLSLSERRKVKLVCDDMQCFQLRRKFDRIVLPYNGLYCLLNRRALLACFRRVRAHLTPDGQFVFDVWAADEFHQDAASSAHYDDTDPILFLAHRDQNWAVFETSRLDARRQRLDVRYTYVSRELGTVVEIPISQRYAPAAELLELLQTAGLEVEATYGDFRQRRRGPRSAHLVVKARRSSLAT